MYVKKDISLIHIGRKNKETGASSCPVFATRDLLMEYQASLDLAIKL